MEINFNSCKICPRECGVDRRVSRGVCGCGAEITVSKVMLHKWEEPSISAGAGAGCIFFAGCPLGCVFCQNKSISRHENGERVTPAELGKLMLELQAKGASTVDLVSPTQYTPAVIEAVSSVRDRLCIPVVWNTGGYERTETIRALSGTVDVFLTDFKFGSEECGKKYAGAPDYVSVARETLGEMVRVAGRVRYSDEGIMTGGVIVRLLVLPGERRDAVRVLEHINDTVGAESIVLSLMSQYTPDFAPEGAEYGNLRRRITTFEYEYVRDASLELGFSGFSQDREAATSAYTPDFL